MISAESLAVGYGYTSACPPRRSDNRSWNLRLAFAVTEHVARARFDRVESDLGIPNGREK